MIVTKASAHCRHQLKNEEGWKLVPYICPAGKWTVGAGHRLYPGDKIQGIWYLAGRWFGKISEATAEAVLDHDMAICEAAVLRLVKVPLTQNQFDALCLFIFNVGVPAFAGSTLLRVLNQRLYGSAAREFDRWVHDDHGKVIGGLVSRRKRERALFSKDFENAEK